MSEVITGQQIPNLDYVGDACPPGWMGYSCDRCTAGCNYEAMIMCDGNPGQCPILLGLASGIVRSNHNLFGFIIREDTADAFIKFVNWINPSEGCPSE